MTTSTIGVRFETFSETETSAAVAAVVSALKDTLGAIDLIGTIRTETVYTDEDGTKVTTRKDERVTQEDE